MEKYLLEMKGINKSFFGVQVLHDAHLEVKPGEVHVLMGENGAGKSTLMKILSADYRKEGGSVFLDGEEVQFRNTQDAINNGIAVIYQELHLNPYTPVYENIFLNREAMKGAIIDPKTMIEKSKGYLHELGVDVDPAMLVGKLSVGKRQMVEIAKALSMNARILVLDEPTAAITDKDTENLFKSIRKLKAQGVGIIYISHRMQEIYEIGDRCTIMRDGKTIGTVELKDTTIDEITTMMVGKEVQFEKLENSYVNMSEAALEVKGLYYKDLLKGIDFTLHKGEILGFAGLVGSGRTEMAKCIIGAYRRQKGTITAENGTIEVKPNTKDSLQTGIVYLSEDRKDEGLVVSHSIAENIALPSLKRFGKYTVSTKMIHDYVHESIKSLHIRANSPTQAAKTLSGGNQQKVVIAKWLSTEAKVYIFDEPTRGIDVGARQDIYSIMMDLVRDGASLIVISSDIVELMKVCDRIAVMYDGSVVKTFVNDEKLTQNEILGYEMTGGVSLES